MTVRYGVQGDPNFPGLNPPENLPFHPDAEKFVYACEQPENPGVNAFDWRCPACVLAAKAYVYTYGDAAIEWHFDDNTGAIVTLSWLIARSEYWGVLERD